MICTSTFKEIPSRQASCAIHAALLCIFVFFLTLEPALAQTSLLTSNTETDTEIGLQTVPQTEEAIRDMVSRLSDQEVRTLLLERMDAVAKAEVNANSENGTVTSSAYSFVKFWALGVFQSSKDAVLKLPVMFSAQAQSISNFIAERGSARTWTLLGLFTCAIALGLIAELVVRTITRKWNTRIQNPLDPSSFKESFRLLSLRLLLDLAGLIVFTIVSAAFLTTMNNSVDREFFGFVLFNLIIIPRLLMAVVRFLLAPNRPELRVVHTDDWTAKFINKHGWGLFLLIGFGASVIYFNAMNGFRPGTIRVGFWLSLLTHGYILYITWQSREGLKKMLIGKHGDVTPLEAKIANIYPYFLIGLTILLWLIVELIVNLGALHLLRQQPHITTLLIFLFVPAIDTLLRALVAHMVPPMQGDGVIATRAYHSTKRSYLRIGRVLMFGLLLMIVMDIWQIRLHSVASDAVGATVASNFIRLMIILSVGYLIWEVVTVLINRKLAAEYTAAGLDQIQEEPGGGEGGGKGASRLSTILPLLRFTLQATVIMMTVLIGLSNIGINVTPLLAGAGVIGIAVGFGSQKLVGDVVSGLFFLIDDAFRAGEYISIDGTVGTIEKISLRSMQLRHHRGAIHTIPYGEIPKLTNYSRDWVLMKLKFTVPFDTDLKKVKNLFKQIGKDVVDLPQFSDDLLQPFKSQGVLAVNDVGIVVGGKFMAKPGTQFMMRKELFLRVQKAFDENGIQFARKEVRVKLDGDQADNLSPEQAKSVATAAASAVDEIDEAAPVTPK